MERLRLAIENNDRAAARRVLESAKEKDGSLAPRVIVAFLSGSPISSISPDQPLRLECLKGALEITSEGRSAALESCIEGAVVHGNPHIVHMLLEYGVPVKNDEANILPAAIRGESEEVLDLLLRYGAPPNASSVPYWFHAVSKTNTRFLRKLFEYGADINALNDRGQSALHTWVSMNRMNMIPGADKILAFLFDRGINPDVRDKFGSIATDLHTSSNYSRRFGEMIKGEIARREAHAIEKLTLGAPASSRSPRL